MPAPTRPVTGASIASVWGQAVHDASFAPVGCIVQGGLVSMLSGQAYRTLPLDTAHDDPGGWLDASNDRLEVPDDAEGLYLIHLYAKSDNGDAGDATGVVLRVNTTELGRSQMQNEGTQDVILTVTTITELSAGDLITVRARQIGTEDDASVQVNRLYVVRLGYEMGAP